MKPTLRVRCSLLIGGLMLTAGACWALQTDSKLFLEGRLVSSDIRVIKGKQYVPLKDVAAAMHCRVVAQKNGFNLEHDYDMARDGTWDPVLGLHGTIGDTQEIFTGKWRFWARSITQMDTYKEKYSSSHDKVTPRKGEILYVVDCRIKNATTDKQAMILTIHSAGLTALTDDQGNAYDVYAYDAHNENGDYGGPTLRPGAEGKFALIFSAPAGVNIRDLIYTIRADPFDTSYGTHIRISIPSRSDSAPVLTNPWPNFQLCRTQVARLGATFFWQGRRGIMVYPAPQERPDF